MEEFGACLNANVYDSILVALVRKGQLGLALSIFCKLLEASNGNDNGDSIVCSLPGSVAINELLVALRKADRIAEFKQVFNKLRGKKEFELDTYGYNICFDSFGCWGDLAASLCLFKDMKLKEKSLNSGSFGPDLCTYNSIIHVLCSVGKVKDTLVVWEESKVSGHEPDAFTYRILIQGCSKLYKINDAMEIFSEMQYNGFAPDTDGVRASCWTYNVLIDGLFRNDRAEAAYTLFCDLKKKGQFVDGVTYSIVVLQLCREGQLEEALRLAEEMEARGFLVDLVTITSLLVGFYKQGWWDWTERLMKHIHGGYLVPNVLKWKANMETKLKNPPKNSKDYTYLFPSRGDFTEMGSYAGQAIGSTFDSLDCDEKDQEMSFIESDQWSSSPYMDRLANQVKSTEHSSRLFSLIRGAKSLKKGDCYTYNSIMSSFVKKGYINEAWSVLNEMDEKVCPADIATYNLIIQGLGKTGRADIASSVLEKLMKHGGYLDIVMYNTLINALGKAGYIDEASRLFEQMRLSGINPDVITYNTFIEVHTKAGQLKDAYRYLKMMLDAGVLRTMLRTP
ncbi:Pentatricopeptide repeat-containing protein [Hibiscus syriacus]|uniref:Pentatricopeptide repeat-containing protein n=1 Tax=Hibiscus syriacus TaxID=106335 RepID=A0A6A2XVJ4_HIBSY|nr:Pentatricopeptide repeat-containing protein [Hibiscus syriacus]